MMRIFVIGAGGVGGYFGGRIAKAGYDVTFIVRGQHFDAIKKNGLQVKSIKGNFIVHPKIIDKISVIENPDLILIATKSWQVIEVAEQLKSVLKSDTLVLPLQNGADNADKLRSILPHKNVLAGLCKIVSKIETAGIINHFVYEPEIIFGEYDNQLTERVKKINTVFEKSEIKNKISTNIHLDIWRKFLFIATVSGIGALTRVPFGDFQYDEKIIEIMQGTANEIRLVANAKDVKLSKKDIEKIMGMFMSMSKNTTASMQRDIMEGRPSELDNFNGYIVRQGEKLGIETPVNSFIYNTLLPQEKIARKEF